MNQFSWILGYTFEILDLFRAKTRSGFPKGRRARRQEEKQRAIKIVILPYYRVLGWKNHDPVILADVG